MVLVNTPRHSCRHFTHFRAFSFCCCRVANRSLTVVVAMVMATAMEVLTVGRLMSGSMATSGTCQVLSRLDRRSVLPTGLESWHRSRFGRAFTPESMQPACMHTTRCGRTRFTHLPSTSFPIFLLFTSGPPQSIVRGIMRDVVLTRTHRVRPPPAEALVSDTMHMHTRMLSSSSDAVLCSDEGECVAFFQG